MPTTTTSPSVGLDLRARRERLGLTRYQLAAQVGCSLTTVANIEAGIVPRSSSVLPRILAALRGLESTEADVAPPTAA